MKQLLEKAIRIAAEAHSGQFDKGGEPYILHPLWVMNKVRHLGTRHMIVAVLHDVIEDTKWTSVQLGHEGFTQETLETLHLLDFRNKDYDNQIKLISLNKIATAVKLADLEHNLKPTRLKGLRKKDHDRIEKYHRAFMYLKD